MRFTVHRPPTGEVSLCWHRPSGGDVAGRVHVGVAPPGFAGDAREDRLALAVFGRDMPTGTASLRREGGRDPFKSARGFMVEPGNQPTPAPTPDCAIQATFLGNPNTGLVERAASGACHRPHVKVLDSNGVEPARQIGCDLLDPVAAAVGFARSESGDRQPGALSAVGAASGAREALLQAAQPHPLTCCQARSVQQFPGGECRRHRHTAIDTNHAGIPRSRDRVGDVGERNMPAPGSIKSDAIRLHTGRHRPRPSESDPADLGHPYPPVVLVELFDMARLHPNLAEAFMYAGFAPRWTPMCAPEEVPHSLGEVPQRLLLHCVRPGRQPVVFGTRVGQLRRLLVVPRGVPPRLPKLMLLHRQIPHEPRMPAMVQQHDLLSGRRQQPEARHMRNVTTATDTNGHRTLAQVRISEPSRRKCRGFKPKEV